MPPLANTNAVFYMGYVIAEKKGQRRKFTDAAWKLLGNNKNGWAEVASQAVSNVAQTVTPAAKPNTGNKPQKITNVKTEESEKAQPVTNVAKEESAQPIVNTVGGASKEQFLKAAESLGKTAIKEFFDSQNPPVKVSNRANIEELREQLGDYLLWNVEAFNKKFN